MHRAALPVLALAALALTGCTAATAAPPGTAEPPGITARATGTVVAAPDTATVVLGVQTRDRSATAALTANSERAAAVIGVLQGAGVAPADIRTSQLAVYPTTAPESGRITGYEVSNQVTATLRDVAAAGAVIDQAARTSARREPRPGPTRCAAISPRRGSSPRRPGSGWGRSGRSSSWRASRRCPTARRPTSPGPPCRFSPAPRSSP